jgi:hypothetical protein
MYLLLRHLENFRCNTFVHTRYKVNVPCFAIAFVFIFNSLHTGIVEALFLWAGLFAFLADSGSRIYDFFLGLFVDRGWERFDNTVSAALLSSQQTHAGQTLRAALLSRACIDAKVVLKGLCVRGNSRYSIGSKHS